MVQGVNAHNKRLTEGGVAKARHRTDRMEFLLSMPPNSLPPSSFTVFFGPPGHFDCLHQWTMRHKTRDEKAHRKAERATVDTKSNEPSDFTFSRHQANANTVYTVVNASGKQNSKIQGRKEKEICVCVSVCVYLFKKVKSHLTFASLHLVFACECVFRFKFKFTMATGSLSSSHCHCN